MSFWPLARTIAEQLTEAAARGPLLELGSGDGRFIRRLAELGLPCWGLDRRYPPAPAAIPAIAGDARRLPFPDAALGGVVLPNLLRHLPAADRPLVVGEAWRALRGKGILLILEDEPHARSAAERNYRRVLELLSRVATGRAEASLERKATELALVDSLGDPYHQGVHENTELVEDPMAPLDWLRSIASGSTEDLDSLRASVATEGMRYGAYWTLLYQKPEDLSP